MGGGGINEMFFLLRMDLSGKRKMPRSENGQLGRAERLDIKLHSAAAKLNMDLDLNYY